MEEKIIKSIESIENYVIELENQNKKLKRDIGRRNLLQLGNLRKEIYTEVINEIRKLKIPISNSATAFAFELQKKLDELERRAFINHGK